jgi:hypothetical protein
LIAGLGFDDHDDVAVGLAENFGAGFAVLAPRDPLGVVAAGDAPAL